MKTLSFFLAATFSLVFAPQNGLFAKNSLPIPAPKNCPMGWIATIQAGTPIFLETTERINSDEATVGKPIRFRVVANVVVNGHVVIATGAFGIGRVKRIEEASFNDPAVVVLEVISVQAANDQSVPTINSEVSFRGKFPNQGVIVEQGQSAVAYSTNNVEIIKW